MITNPNKNNILDKNQHLKQMIIRIPALNYILTKFGFELSSYILLFIGNTLFVLAFIYSNENKLNFVETAFLRGVPVILIHLLIFRLLNLSTDVISFRNLKLLTIRNSLMVIQMFGLAAVQFYLPLPVVHNIAATGPILIFIIDYFKNGIKINCKQIIGTAIGFLGILLVVNNEFVSKLILKSQKSSQHTEFQNYASQDPFVILAMEMVLVAITLMYAIGIVITKDIKTTSLHVGLNLGVLLTFCSGILYPIIVVNPVKQQTFYLGFIISGSMFAFSQIIYLLALFLNHNTGVLTILNLLNIAESYLLSIVRYKQKVDFFQSIGTVAIVLGVLMVVLYQK